MIKNQALGGRSNRALIFLGLFLGLVSAALVVVYLSKAGGDGGEVSAAKTPVVVASQDIPAATKITAEMVTLKSISADAVLPEVFLKTEDVIGKITRVPVVAGEQVIPSRVAATGTAITDIENPPLAYVVPEGMRAVSISVSSEIAASGLIRPGDFVDVILTVQSGDESESRNVRDQIARTILQNAQVLSIGRNVALPSAGDQSAPPVSDEGADADADAGTVTLAVSPVHGEVLTVAETCGTNFGGRLALALRAFGDSAGVGTRSVWASDGPPPSCAALLGLTSLQ
jgi:pilus assembly protein CpaB